MDNLKRLDAAYFSDRLGIVVRDLSHYTPQEMARELVRLAKVADESEAATEAARSAVPAQASAVDEPTKEMLEAGRRCMPREGEKHSGMDYVYYIYKAMRAASHPAQASAAEVPEGWQLVPVEPTKAMYEANVLSLLDGDDLKGTWRKMVAAAPAAPQAANEGAASHPAQGVPSAAPGELQDLKRWTPSIDTPEFRALLDGYYTATKKCSLFEPATVKAQFESRDALVTYIDAAMSLAAAQAQPQQGGGE